MNKKDYVADAVKHLRTNMQTCAYYDKEYSYLGLISRLYNPLRQPLVKNFEDVYDYYTNCLNKQDPEMPEKERIALSLLEVTITAASEEYDLRSGSWE